MNIQSLPWLKFAHEAYLVSEFKAKANAIAKAAYFDLLCFAMKQSPALSLPNCDDALAGWASLTLEAWQQIKDIVLSQFSLNPNDNRYYSPMLVELYSLPSNSTELKPHNSGELHQIKKRTSSAERMANKRARDKLKASQQAQCDANVSLNTVTCDNHVTHQASQVTAQSVTLGGKGGDLDLKLENLEKEVVVNTDFLNNQSVTPCNAVTPKSVTPHTTTKFCIPFDFTVEPSELEPFMAKLEVPMTKHTSSTLNHFVAHYLAKDFKNTRDEWIYQYAKWLQREKETPVDNSSPQPTKLAAEFIQPVKPLWETLADKKAQKQAQQPKAESALAASALAQIKKSVGLKAA